MLPIYRITNYEMPNGGTKIYVFRPKKNKNLLSRIKAYLTDISKAHIQQRILGCLLFLIGSVAIPFVGLECIFICFLGIARIVY